MAANTYNWIIRLVKKDHSVEYIHVVNYSLSAMRVYVRNLSLRKENISINAFKCVDIL